LRAALKSTTAADDRIQNYAAAEIKLLRAEVAKLCWERDDLDKQHKRVFEDRERLRGALAGATIQAVSALITVHDIIRVFVRRGIPGVTGELAEADERVLAALTALAQSGGREFTDSTGNKEVLRGDGSSTRVSVEANSAYDTCPQCGYQFSGRGIGTFRCCKCQTCLQSSGDGNIKVIHG
jgi:hypothetical protein